MQYPLKKHPIPKKTRQSSVMLSDARADNSLFTTALTDDTCACMRWASEQKQENKLDKSSTVFTIELESGQQSCEQPELCSVLLERVS
jgi:hypothetical protein